MRVLLTGATGYIGESVMETFLRAGHQVTVLARNPGRIAAAVGDVLWSGPTWAGPPTGPASPKATTSSCTRPSRPPRRDPASTGRPSRRCSRRGGRPHGRADRRRSSTPPASGCWAPQGFRLPKTRRSLRRTSWPGGLPSKRWCSAPAEPGLRTAVVRPGIVFGGARGIVGDMLRGASNGLIRVVGTGQNRWPLVYAA